MFLRWSANDSFGKLASMKTSIFLSLFLLPALLFSRVIDTFYGPLEVEEPVLLELIDSTAMQRLKEIHQYGIAYYTSHSEEYNRFDHSIGVFALLRMKGAPLDEQIAGLLHDVSHTVFSHVGDYLFQQENHQNSYQDDIHSWFLKQVGIDKILEKHGYTVEQVDPKSKRFHALEQRLPNLCADRIDYNLQGAYFQRFLTKAEVLELVQDLKFENGQWISTKPHLMKKMVRFSIFMTRSCWGSATNYLVSKWFAEIMNHALKLGELTLDEVYYGTDDAVWNKLRSLKEPFIEALFEKIFNARQYYTFVPVSEADLNPRLKFRGIDPLIEKGKRIHRLTECDQEMAIEYRQGKALMARGWPIKLH